MRAGLLSEIPGIVEHGMSTPQALGFWGGRLRQQLFGQGGTLCLGGRPSFFFSGGGASAAGAAAASAGAAAAAPSPGASAAACAGSATAACNNPIYPSHETVKDPDCGGRRWRYFAWATSVSCECRPRFT